MKDTFLWSSRYSDNYKTKEEAIRDLGELIMSDKDYENENEITDEDITDYFYESSRMLFAAVTDELITHDKNHRPSEGAYLVKADIGAWDGRREGGKIINDLKTAISECVDYDDSEIEIKDDSLCITGYHHDGTNYFTIYFVTPNGLSWAYNNYGYAMHNSRECHEHLLKTKGYTRKMFSRDWKFEW